MPSVIFHVSGKSFDVDLAVRALSFRPYKVYHAGEVMNCGRPGAQWTDSGFSAVVGPQDSSNLSEQIEGVSQFLDRHFGEIRALKGVDDMRFDFGYLPRRGGDGEILIAQCDYFSPALLRKCGELGIGIELSLYNAGCS